MRKTWLKHFADDWNIRQKGLLLVGIPVAFQVVLTAILAWLYLQTEQQAWKESQARLLMVRSNQIMSTLYSAGQILVIYTAFPNNAVYDRWLEKREAFINELDAIKQVSLQSNQSSKSYERLLALSNRGISVLDECFQLARVHQAGSIFQTMPKAKSFSDSIYAELNLIFTDDLKGEAAHALSQDRARKLIVIFLWVGIATDALIAVGLSQFFGATIENRLGVLADNAKKMATRKKLNPALEGTDEIASLDKEFHQLSQELRESEQIRSEFISMVSHDIKTPLMSVQLSLEQIESESSFGGNAKLASEINAVNSNMRHVMLLVQDLLDLERGASGKLNLQLQELSVDKLFERVAKNLEAFCLKKNVQLVTNSSGESVFADRRRLDQVLMNIVSNALKHAPAGSKVVLAAAKQDSGIEIRIKDNGPGVPVERREQIFERFVQAAGSDDSSIGANTGLGLAICKTIIEAHGGQLGFEPNPDGGSEFWIRLKDADI